MATASCYFRGNYMNIIAAQSLLDGICAEPELFPDTWNIYEPINRRFSQEQLSEVVAELVSNPTQLRSLVFFARNRRPSFLLYVDLRISCVQGSTPHNRIHFESDDGWNGREHILSRFLPRCTMPSSPDYVCIPDWQEDKERYGEFKRSYKGKEFVAMLGKKEITAPFGPYGCLADIHWFNYFGRDYVQAIGHQRLLGAGWERVEEIGGGFACYATEEIDDLASRERRSAIAKEIEEYVWSPGCKPFEKKIVEFDYS